MDAIHTIKSKIKELSLDELRETNGLVVDEINHRSRLRDMTALMKFRVGMQVEFGNTRRGMFTGKVLKINQRSLTVKQDNSNTNWTVGPNSCRIIAEES